MACGPGELQAPPQPPVSSARFGEQLHSGGPWFQACGQTNVTCRVVKGRLVEVGKWPWQASILYLGVYICSGSLIHQQWELTAAHCLQRSKDPTLYSVKVGVQNFLENGTQIPLSRIAVHENFSNLMTQDIALLKLKTPISWSPAVQPVCLPNIKTQLTIGSTCWVIGWGLAEGKRTKVTPKSSYHHLQEMSVRILKNDVCNQRYQFLFLQSQREFVGKDMLCASSEWGQDTCQGNSGSSLVCQQNGSWIQMGVVSWSFNCGRRQFPGIYTSTTHFTQWIKKQVSDMKFVSRAGPALLSPVLHACCMLLLFWGSLGLL
ncbi:putative serine protease 46 [Tupaia chinensis]|uniref:putative serine protease 46 n=1 Tax=Tupaia chinensis TaxID=246437 RepID=UPI0003C8CE08|nr:putative serine protease 46 [Tupaia chinensis]